MENFIYFNSILIRFVALLLTMFVLFKVVKQARHAGQYSQYAWVIVLLIGVSIPPLLNSVYVTHCRLIDGCVVTNMPFNNFLGSIGDIAVPLSWIFLLYKKYDK